MDHFRHDHDVVLRLHDGVVVVVEVVRQHRRPGIRAERSEAAVGERPHFGAVELAELLREAARSAMRCLPASVSRGRARRRIDEDRAARHAIDADDPVTRVEPKAVVAADVAAGRLGNPLDERGFARYRRQLVGAVGLGRLSPPGSVGRSRNSSTSAHASRARPPERRSAWGPVLPSVPAASGFRCSSCPGSRVLHQGCAARPRFGAGAFAGVCASQT